MLRIYVVNTFIYETQMAMPFYGAPSLPFFPWESQSLHSLKRWCGEDPSAQVTVTQPEEFLHWSKRGKNLWYDIQYI